MLPREWPDVVEEENEEKDNQWYNEEEICLNRQGYWGSLVSSEDRKTTEDFGG